MRDPWGLNERFFAMYYPWLMGLSEQAGGAAMRRRIIAQASGRTLEIGAGNGYNLPHYTSAVSELIVTEPSPHMLAHLDRRLGRDAPPVGSWDLHQTGAEQLPFDDACFDTVTSGYVHCSIPDPKQALREIKRVLKPGGRYLFLEHVRAAEGTWLARYQDLIEPLHVYVAAGCHPTRRTEQWIAEAGLTIETIEHVDLPRSPHSVRPVIMGAARR